MNRDDICWHCGGPHKPTDADVLHLFFEIERVRHDSFVIHDVRDEPILQELFRFLNRQQVGKLFERVAKGSLDCDGLTVERVEDDARDGAIWRIKPVTRV